MVESERYMYSRFWRNGDMAGVDAVERVLKVNNGLCWLAFPRACLSWISE